MKKKFISLCIEKFKNHSFEKTTHRGYFSVSPYLDYIEYRFVERGGIKEGWEIIKLKYNEKDYQKLVSLLRYL